MKNRCVNLLLLGIPFLLINCKKHPVVARNIQRSFYYWKSVVRLTNTEKKDLNTLQVKTLYIKFFDVDWNKEQQAAEPKAIVRIPDTAYIRAMKINIIPVVFITNECIHQLDSTQVPALAKKITSLLKGMLSVDHITAVSQLQIDCDWSYPTRKNYFVLLKQIRSNTATIAASISCTIRLHQVKYLSGSGIPPVDRGLLMCYNMGDMEDPTATNSIIQATEINKYIGNLRSYPLQLDVALPLFEWGVLFRDNKYKGLVEDLHILNTSAFEEMNDHMHFLIRDTVINGVQYKKNDIIRTERSDYNEIMKTAGLINERLRTQNLHLALFHLDSVILNKYPTNELENIYSSLR